MSSPLQNSALDRKNLGQGFFVGLFSKKERWEKATGTMLTIQPEFKVSDPGQNPMLRTQLQDEAPKSPTWRREHFITSNHRPKQGNGAKSIGTHLEARWKERQVISEHGSHFLRK